jgi:hypothetical protein
MDQTRGGNMKARKLTALAAAATMAIAGTAVGTAQAKHGADDPAGHQRHGADDAQPHAKRAHHKHHRHHGHHRHGADDGPNHT